ncbi:MAG: hypothetical protein HeimC2_08220 [Candidatus Heimdallarchaeota archaeon LC_2]|nr:MAG: hypothetical protein HeimC2_08220 [Candidatus Heimdallarchaeota archaeon LC_2]
MNIEHNKRLAKIFLEEIYGNWKISLIDDLFHPHYSIIPHPILPKVTNSIDGEKMMVNMFQIAFPDLKVNIKKMVAENNTVSVYWKATGTHTGSWFGAQGTKNKVSFRGSHYFTFQEDKIIEISLVFDSLTLYVQLGQDYVKQKEEIELVEYLESIKSASGIADNDNEV